MLLDAETRRQRRKTRRTHFWDWLRFLERRAGGSKPESAEAAEIIGLRREAEALFWKEETRQWRISTGHNALRWRASSASGAAHGYSEALARRFRRYSRTFRI